MPWPEDAGTFQGGLPDDYVPPDYEEPVEEMPWPEDAGMPPYEAPVPPPPMQVHDFFDVEEELMEGQADPDNMPWPQDAGKVPYVGGSPGHGAPVEGHQDQIPSGIGDQRIANAAQA